MRVYQATIKFGPNRITRQRVFIEADDIYKARLLLAAQYGEGNFMDVTEVPPSRRGRG